MCCEVPESLPSSETIEALRDLDSLGSVSAVAVNSLNVDLGVGGTEYRLLGMSFTDVDEETEGMGGTDSTTHGVVPNTLPSLRVDLMRRER